MQEEEKGEQQGEEESAGVMKPDIVFFGEGLPDEFHHALEDDKTEVRSGHITSTLTLTCKPCPYAGGSADCHGIFS
jgi:NAD-dependent SIR2 family protein deacetylase